MPYLELKNGKLYTPGSDVERYELVSAEANDSPFTMFVVCPYLCKAIVTMRIQRDSLTINCFDGRRIRVKEM